MCIRDRSYFSYRVIQKWTLIRNTVRSTSMETSKMTTFYPTISPQSLYGNSRRWVWRHRGRRATSARHVSDASLIFSTQRETRDESTSFIWCNFVTVQRGHTLKLEKPGCISDSRKFFLHGGIGRWNSLEQGTADAPSIDAFKGRLENRQIRVGFFID